MCWQIDCQTLKVFCVEFYSKLLSHSERLLQGPGMQGVPPSGGGFSPGQSQVSNQDKEKVCCLFFLFFYFFFLSWPMMMQHSKNSKEISQASHRPFLFFCKSSWQLILGTETVCLFKLGCKCLTSNAGCQWRGLRETFWFHQLRESEKMGSRRLKSLSCYVTGKRSHLIGGELKRSGCVCVLPGRTDHAGAAADPGTDRHVAPGAAAEHPHSQRADSEDCRRSAVRMKTPQKAKKFSISHITSNTATVWETNSLYHTLNVVYSCRNWIFSTLSPAAPRHLQTSPELEILSVLFFSCMGFFVVVFFCIRTEAADQWTDS